MTIKVTRELNTQICMMLEGPTCSGGTSVFIRHLLIESNCRGLNILSPTSCTVKALARERLCQVTPTNFQVHPILMLQPHHSSYRR